MGHLGQSQGKFAKTVVCYHSLTKYPSKGGLTYVCTVLSQGSSRHIGVSSLGHGCRVRRGSEHHVSITFVGNLSPLLSEFFQLFDLFVKVLEFFPVEKLGLVEIDKMLLIPKIILSIQLNLTNYLLICF